MEVNHVFVCVNHLLQKSVAEQPSETEICHTERHSDNTLTCVCCRGLVDPCKTQLITIFYTTTRHGGQHTDLLTSADVYERKGLQLPHVIISQY